MILNNFCSPAKLKIGDEVRVIAPSRSIALFTEFQRQTANRRFAEMGLSVTFGKHVWERDEFDSASIESRVADIHEAFSDPKVKAVISVIGGTNVNSILDHLDFELIRKNPKILCGYSDFTALANAIYSQTGLMTYSGPHWTTFSMVKELEFTIDHFKKCLFASWVCSQL